MLSFLGLVFLSLIKLVNVNKYYDCNSFKFIYTVTIQYLMFAHGKW